MEHDASYYSGPFKPGFDPRRRTAGRPVGWRKPKPLVILPGEIMNGFQGSPVEFLEAVYKNPELPLDQRIGAAAILVRAGAGGTTQSEQITIIHMSPADQKLL